ncbi:8704_t:CDS:2 [Funneliformis mosseae]|uniref:8704_t:CDS:1 n=1 Tax=Funneliformis mosseae TaxID=27381 RepID=A0A9N8Z1I7_FUNMO|nr:8704_t:CDS:2 [Funneliformis mosseae]
MPVDEMEEECRSSDNSYLWRSNIISAIQMALLLCGFSIKLMNLPSLAENAVLVEIGLSELAECAGE